MRGGLIFEIEQTKIAQDKALRADGGAQNPYEVSMNIQTSIAATKVFAHQLGIPQSLALQAAVLTKKLSQFISCYFLDRSISLWGRVLCDKFPLLQVRSSFDAN